MGLHVHIAAPPSESSFVQDAKKLIYATISKSDIDVSTTLDIETYLKNKFDVDCKIFKNYWNEVVSLIEQALIEKSQDFYYWPLSTWSERIMDLRKYRQPENPRYFDIIEEIVKTKLDKGV